MQLRCCLKGNTVYCKIVLTVKFVHCIDFWYNASGDAALHGKRENISAGYCLYTIHYTDGIPFTLPFSKLLSDQ